MARSILTYFHIQYTTLRSYDCCNVTGIPLKSKATSQGEDDGGDVVGIVSGVMVVILLLAVAAVGTVLLVIFMSKRHKRKQMERMQLDILAM